MSAARRSLLQRSLTARLQNLWRLAEQSARTRAVDVIAYEAAELDNIFAVLVLGVFIGIPAPPIHLTMELLPMLETECQTMLARVATAHDPLGDLFSILGVD